MSTIACVFPGQGSQSLEMLAELAAQHPVVRTVFEEVSSHLDYDVWQLTQQGPLEVLNQTAHTQVAMLAADVAVYRVLASQVSLTSAILAGHSLGEYAALVCAGVLSLTDAARVVQLRGQLMQETVPLGTGAMAAIIGLTDDEVRTLCTDVSTETAAVSPANYNAIGQVVIAGHTLAVERAIALADERGARMAKVIPVSVPCHCDLLAPAAIEFAHVLDSVVFHSPKQTVLSTVDLNVYQNVERMRPLLAAQLYRPVRWVEVVQAMKKQGISHVFECGPGKVLGGLMKRIEKSLPVISVNDPASLALALEVLS